MSRRCHHGSPRHAAHLLRAPRRPTGSGSGMDVAPRPDADLVSDATIEPAVAEAAEPRRVEVARSRPIPEPPTFSPSPMTSTAVRTWQPPRLGSRDRPPARETVDGDPQAQPGPPSIERVATAPQLRRFIKSRAYVPMHELRRRFAINGGDDDVTQVALERSHVYVGLPEREGQLLGELLRGGDIGYELSLDPISPIVVGVYPMRPVTRG